MKPKLTKSLLSSLVVLALTGCTVTSEINSGTRSFKTPETWQHKVSAMTLKDTPITKKHWLSYFDNKNLIKIVQKALKNNQGLKAQYYVMLQSKERWNIANTSDWPELNLTINNSRRKSISKDQALSPSSAQYSTNAEISLQLSYEIDLWGKLAAEQKKSYLTMKSAQMSYQKAELSLIENVVRTWFTLVEAQELLALYQSRATNLQDNLAMIQSSYRLGLSKALDVYLTQNDVSKEQARVADQKHKVLTQKRNLEILLGEYPDGDLSTSEKLFDITQTTYFNQLDLGIPANILTKRPDLQSNWYAMLAADAELAVAHKQRFPRFSISANTNDSADELRNLLDGGALAWSLIGNLTTPIFNAGRLSSLEEQARLNVKQKEQLYLQGVYNAFLDIETNLSSRESLLTRLTAFKKARENALSAESLAFDQYLKGIVSYTTVLESQRRAFDAQSTVIQLQNQLIQNQVSMHVALGHDALLITSKQNNTEEES